tara:strand:- start:886 stop:1398 length:513 start_codon:yes stop_codon:yes gene_type:complete
MYFWNIEKLKQTLVKGPLSQKDIFKYLVYFLFLYWIASIGSAEGNYYPSISKWITYPTLLIADFLELFTSYRFNGGRNGNDFLGRYFPIKLLTSLRLFIFACLIVGLILLPLSWEFIDSEDIITELFEAQPTYEIIFAYTFFIFWRLILPLRIILHMRSIKKNEVRNNFQ